MSKARYYVYSKVEPFIGKNNNQEFLNLDDVAKKLNDYVEQVEELKAENEKLEEQLKNAIVPKFKGNDVAWRIHWYTIERVVIVNTKIEIVVNAKITYTIAILEGNDTLENLDNKFFENINSYIDQVKESDLFATKEQAEQKLKELRGVHNE